MTTTIRKIEICIISAFLFTFFISSVAAVEASADREVPDQSQPISSLTQKEGEESSLKVVYKVDGETIENEVLSIVPPQLEEVTKGWKSILQKEDFHLPEGYQFANPEQIYEIPWKKDAKGMLIPDISELEVLLQKIEDAFTTSETSLTVKYLCLKDSEDKNTFEVVYEEKLENFVQGEDHYFYAGDKEKLAELGYVIVENKLFGREKEISLNYKGFADEYFHFLIWQNTKPIPLISLTFIVRPIATNIEVGFKDGDHTILATTKIPISKDSQTLTINKNNIGALPEGYELVDEKQEFTIQVEFDENGMLIIPEAVYFDVRPKNLPLETPDLPNEQGIKDVELPELDIELQNVPETKMFASAKTGDTTVELYDQILLGLILGCMLGLVIYDKSKKAKEFKQE